jgi:ATP-binding cassette subfamily B protein
VAPERIEGAIAFKDVNFTYEGTDDPVLHNISFEAEPGQRIALLGATGSGKTSLVNLLPRFYAVQRRPHHARRTGVDRVSAGLPAATKSVSWNRNRSSSRARFATTSASAWAETVSDEEIEAAARAAAIHDVIMDVFPDGYDTLVGERGVTLSGGQKQRVAIARTLLKDPGILILDDSTSAVDTETEAMIRQALERLMEGRTTFVIAHRIQSLMAADKILVLEHGRIVQSGTHDALMREPGMYQRIYRAQTRIESELEEELNRVRA